MDRSVSVLEFFFTFSAKNCLLKSPVSSKSREFRKYEYCTLKHSYVISTYKVYNSKWLLAIEPHLTMQHSH